MKKYIKLEKNILILQLLSEQINNQNSLEIFIRIEL